MVASHRRTKRLKITVIDTFQGKTRAPRQSLYQHFSFGVGCSLGDYRSHCITNSQVCQVIDSDCAPYFGNNKGLGEFDMLVPLNVHAHLVDRKVLSVHQKQFEEVAGSNNMVPDYFGEF
jgi:hypothetical protein